MFETIDEAELSLPIEFAGPGKRCWWYVKRSLHTYWFQVIYSSRSESCEELSSIILFSRINHFLEFANLDDIEILKAYITTPGYMNGTDQWKTEPFMEIWEIEEQEKDAQPFHFIKLEDRREYSTNTANPMKGKDIKRTLLFSC